MSVKLTKKSTSISFSIENLFHLSSDAPVARAGVFNWILLFFLIAFSVVSWIYYYSHGYSLSYNDARSHLNVSRRVVDSLQPGLAQLGSVWLPLQHVLALPMIDIDVLYRTGLAGSLVSMVAYVGSAILLFGILRRLGVDNFTSFIGTLIFAVNQNLLFLQSTPMTEPLMLFTMLFTVYFLTRWVNDHGTQWLVLAGCGVFLATLTRYDGWFLFVMAAGLIGIYTFFAKGSKKIESQVLLFSTVGGLGIALWLLWNKMIFGDWLFFMNGPFSAKAQQDLLFQAGRLLTRGNMGFSAVTYFWSMWFNLGLPVVTLGVLGGLKLIVSRDLRRFVIYLMLFSAIVFNVLSLYGGQSVIHLPNLPPYTWFNVRYGLMGLPAMILGIAVLLEKRKVAAILCMLVVGIHSGWVFFSNSIITIQDGVRGSSGYFLDDIGEWVHKNANDGLILVAASSHDALLFISRLPIKNYITEGAEKYWVESMKNPRTYAKYIVMHDGDIVWEHMKNNPNFEGHYQLIYEGKFSNVYKRLE